MDQVVSNATSQRRFNMSILVFFAVASLVLTMMGIYGVVAFLVGRQVREIGIRVALGAQRGDILRLQNRAWPPWTCFPGSGDAFSRIKQAWALIPNSSTSSSTC